MIETNNTRSKSITGLCIILAIGLILLAVKIGIILKNSW